MNQQQQILQDYGVTPVQPGQTAQPQQLNINPAAVPAFNATRNISGALQNLGLGYVPMVAGSVAELGRTGATALGEKNLYQPNTNPFLTDTQLAQYSTPLSGAEQGAKNIAGAEAYAAGGLNPLGMSKAALAARGLIGFGSGVGMNVAQGQGKNIKRDIGSGLIGAGVNALLPPAFDALAGTAAKLSMGKTAGAIPQIAKETGQNITGIGSQGAKAAAADIGQKIGDVYGSMKTGLTKNDIFSMLDDTTKQDTYGNMMPSNLDMFMKQAGIPAEQKTQVLSFIKEMALGSRMKGNMAARAAKEGSGTINKEFNAALSRYLQQAPDISAKLGTQPPDVGSDLFKKQLEQYVSGNPDALKSLQSSFGQNLEKITPDAAKQLRADVVNYITDNPQVQQTVQTAIHNSEVGIPGQFWHQFVQDVEPSQAVFDSIKQNPDKELATEDKIRLALGQNIRSLLQSKLTQERPDLMPRLQQLNHMYGQIVPIAKGTAKSIIPHHMQMMAPLALGYTAYNTATGQKGSPYFNLLAALGALMNPQLSGSLASKAALPATNAIENAVGSLGASQLMGKPTQ